MLSVDVYLSSDEMWLCEFFKRTHLSTSEIGALIREMPGVLRSETPCTNASAWLAVRTYSRLNVKYLHRMLAGRGDLAMSVWSLRAFHNRNYLDFMNGLALNLQESLLTAKVIPRFDSKVVENLILHNTCQLRFPVEATRGLEFPRPRDIHKAFGDVKAAVAFGSAVDRTSKRLVVQAISYDVESLKYMNQIAGLGVLSMLSDRLFGLYKNTLDIIRALPEE